MHASRERMPVGRYFLPMLAPVLVVAIALSPGLARAQPEADRSLDTANGLLSRELYDLAAAEYRSFLRDHPRHSGVSTARYALGVCCSRLGTYEEAISVLDDVPSDPSFEFAFEAALVRADCLVRVGRVADASSELARLLRRSPDHAASSQAAALLVETLHRGGKHEECVRVGEQTVERWPRAPERARVELWRGMSLVALGRFREAERVLAGVVDGNASPSIEEPALLALAGALHGAGECEAAARRYREVLERGGDDNRAAALLGLGRACRDAKAFDEAHRSLERFVEGYPDHPSIGAGTLELALVCFDAERYEACQRFARRVLDGTDDSLHASAAYWVGASAMRMGRYDEAAGRFEHALETYPRSPLAARTMYDLGIARVRSGDSTGARTLARFRSRYPDHALAPDALYAEAIVALENEAFEDARRLALLFLKSHSGHARASEMLFVSGEAAYLAGRYADATEAFEAVLESDPSDSRARRARFRLGMSLFRQGRMDDARSYLEPIVRGEPVPDEFRPALAALGEMEFDAGRWDLARDLLQRYVDSAGSGPGVAGALLRLGLALAQDDRHVEALARFDALLSGAPGSVEADQARFERARSLLALGRRGEGIDALEEVVGASPASRFAPNAQRLLGDLALASGDSEEALRRFSSAAETGGTDVALAARYDQARAMLEAGDAAGALEQLSVLLRRDGLSDSLQSHARAARAMALSRLGRHTEALRAIDGVDPSVLDPGTRRALAYERGATLVALGRGREARGALNDLLEGGPRYDEIALHAMLLSAGLEMDAGRPDDAAALLDALLSAVGSSAERIDRALVEAARYRRGLCARELGDDAGVIRTLGTFREEFPGSSLAPSADLLCAESLVAVGRRLDAIGHLEVASSASSPADVRESALVRLGGLGADVQRWDVSREAYAALLESFPASEQRYRAQFGVGWALENEGDRAGAVQAYEAVIASHTGETAARAQFQIGECLFADGAHERAAREFLRVEILYDYPAWSAAALFEAGRCFEALNKNGEARAQYRRVLEEYDDTTWSVAARERLQRLADSALPARSGD